MKKNSHASQVVEVLGGTAEVARLFTLSMPSVANWKKNGVPSARMMFLQAAYSDRLAGIDLKAATAEHQKSRRKQQQVS